MKYERIVLLCTAAFLYGMLSIRSVQAAGENGWHTEEDGCYWYENGEKQGTEGRGKEVYDPASGAWYWLDAAEGGRKAVDRDVYQESPGSEYSEGKWCRYDSSGRMVKGWDVRADGTWYFDPINGAMLKGEHEIDHVSYFFHEIMGSMESCSISVENHWEFQDGKAYWYEGGIRQGFDVSNSGYRGKEIYDPASDAWYWLDNVQQGAMTTGKDVYQESEAGPWAEREDGTGKWVRYDSEGHMVKGWDGDGNYYFDPIYGTMAKGEVRIDGQTYFFNQVTGILEREPQEGADTSPAPGNPGTNPSPDNPGIDSSPDKPGVTPGPDTPGEEHEPGQTGESPAPEQPEGLDWEITEEGILIVKGHMEGLPEWGWYNAEGLRLEYWSWLNAPWAGRKKEITAAKLEFSGAQSLNRFFYNYEKLQSVDLNGLDTGDVTDMAYLFYSCSSLRELDLSTLETGSTTRMNDMFSWCTQLRKLNLQGMDTSRVTDMSRMFMNCFHLEELDLSGFDTSCVRNMSAMFRECHALKLLDLRSFDTSGVTSMSSLFFNCEQLEQLYLGELDTSNVTDMRAMFLGCTGLQYLDLRSFCTASATNMNSMFYRCPALKALRLDSFDTSNVMDMGEMFCYCSSLESLDLRSFCTKNVSYAKAMFAHCTGLKEILVGDGWTMRDREYFFTGCGVDHVTLVR